jgi:DNA-binding NtrC family response regulator
MVDGLDEEVIAVRRKDLVKDKRILIVDDEPDVLETLQDLLEMCDVVKAFSFNAAKELLETQYFDIAVLDIMGVDGYKLLDIANHKNVIVVMLTAHAMSPENTIKSFKEGAACFIPKDEIVNITIFLNDVLEAKEKRKHLWSRWLDRFGSYYDDKYGPDWKSGNEEFWKDFPYT